MRRCGTRDLLQEPARGGVDGLTGCREEPILRRSGILVFTRVPELYPPLSFVVGYLDCLSIVFDEQKSGPALASQGSREAPFVATRISSRQVLSQSSRSLLHGILKQFQGDFELVASHPVTTADLPVIFLQFLRMSRETLSNSLLDGPPIILSQDGWSRHLGCRISRIWPKSMACLKTGHSRSSWDPAIK